MDAITFLILLLKILLLTSSLFIPGYFLLSSKYTILTPLLSKISPKNKNSNISEDISSHSIQQAESKSKILLKMDLSFGEFLGCCFAISVSLIVSLSFIIGILGLGLIEFFDLYFLASTILAGLFILINLKKIPRFFPYAKR